MNCLKNIDVLLYKLILLLSLTSLTGISHHSNNKALKTALIVNEYSSEDISFSVQFIDIVKYCIITSNYLNYSFKVFISAQNVKETIAFKGYTKKTLLVKTEKLKTKLYSFFKQQNSYNNFIV